MRSSPRRAAGPALVVAVLLVVIVMVLVSQRPAGVTRPGDTGASASPARATASSAGTATPSGSATPSGVAGSGAPQPGGAAPTGGPGQPAPVVLAAGDVAKCDLPFDQDTARLIAGMPGTVLALGDLAYEAGSAKQFANCYDPTWGAFKDRTRPVPGNHEWRTADLAGYRGYWAGRGFETAGEPWYSFDLGTWHLVALDADCSQVGGCDASSPQGTWLAADLAASHAQCTLAFWHQPRFSSGVHGNDKSVSPFWTALAAAGADVVLNGHDHDYERFAPQDPDGTHDTSRGIREFVVGTGGAELRGFASVHANSRVRIADAHGVLRLVLRDGSYSWSFISTDGSPLDEGHATCH